MGTQVPLTEDFNMIVFGVDSGQKGGLAVVECSELSAWHPKLLLAERMRILNYGKKKIVDACEVQRMLSPLGAEAAIIEQVSAMPKQGVVSSFQFGRSFGAIEAITYMCVRRIEYVTAASWKKTMKLSSDKQQSLDMARIKFGENEMWNVKANDGIAEAALLCLWYLDKYRC